MPSKRQNIIHRFGGGLVTDVGPSINTGASQSGEFVFPFLTTAQNIFYEPDGAPHKIPGTTRLNSSAVASGAEIMGLFDYWLFGTTGTATQKRIIHVSTVIMADAADGSFSNVQTAMTDNATPCYTQFRGNVYISSTAGDAPQVYDGSTCSALGGSPPLFQFSVWHRDRLWVAGIDLTPNLVRACSSNDATVWSGGTSVSLSVGVGASVGTNDGDRITGLCSVGADLLVFKGPNYGSIWKITGSSNTGSDAFAVSPNPLVRGIGAVWHSTIFKFRNDVGFMSPNGSIHSLSNALNYAGYGEAALSRPIWSYIRDNINLAQLKRCWVAVNEARSFAWIGIPLGSGNFPTQILHMDYSRDQVWWAQIPAFNGCCGARVVDSADSNKVKIFLGGTDGFVRITDAADRSIDTTGAYTGKAVTPFTNYGSPLLTKTICNVSASMVTKGNYNVTLGITRDKQPQQTAQLAQVASNTAWPFVDVFVDTGFDGEFKNIQYEVSNATLSQDFEVHSIAAAIEPGAEDTAPLPSSGA